jgi:hypothetical protein
VGRYLCFTRSDWNKGLPHLANGSDATLKALAAQEAKSPAATAEQTKLGDDWWDLAQKANGKEREGMLLRAEYWYKQAIRAVSAEIVRIKIEKRLAEIAKLSEPTTEASAGKEKADTSKAKRTARGRQETAIYLSTLRPQVVVATSPPNIRLSVGGKPVLRGIWAHPPASNSSSRIVFALPEGAIELQGAAAINDTGAPATPLTFRIMGDGKLLWQSRPLRQKGEIQLFEIKLSRVRLLEMYVDCPGGHGSTHAIWADPLLRVGR